MSPIYVKARSWHVVVGMDEPTGYARTRCGRNIDVATHPVADGFGSEKSCESCLRLKANDDADSGPDTEPVP